MKREYTLIRIIILSLFLSPVYAQTNISFENSSQNLNWTFFRGSDLNGISSNKGLPLTWSENENITWKTPIHGIGASSPVVFGDQFVTQIQRSAPRLCRR